MGWGNTLKAVNMDFNHVTRAYLNENHTEGKWKLKGDIHEQYGATYIRLSKIKMPLSQQTRNQTQT